MKTIKVLAGILLSVVFPAGLLTDSAEIITSAKEMDKLVRQLGEGVSITKQVMNDNTIYEIREMIDLRGQSITIPDDCVIKFSGGALINGSLNGNGTILDADPLQILGDNVTLKGTWNIKEVSPEWFGAIGDGITDDSKALQKALNLASFSTGQKVCLMGKSYLINSQINIPDAVEMFGVYSKDDVSLDKSTVIVCTNKSINNQEDGLLRLGGSVYLHDMKFWYPSQKGFESEKSVITYAPSILVKENSDYVTLERIAFAGSYIGIRAEFHKNLTINSCVGYCFKYGIYDIASHDIDRISDCHFNFNYLWQNDAYKKHHAWPQGAYGLYRYSFQNNTAAFKIGQCDWIVLSNCFAYGYNTGFDIGSSTVANHNLNIIGGGSDSCKKGIRLVNCHYAHLSDVTVTFGDVWGSGEAVNISDRKGVGICIQDSEEIKLENITHQFARGTTLLINNSKRVVVSNCNYRATGFNTNEDWAVLALGTSSFAFSNCIFSGWGTNDKRIEGGGLGCIAVVYDKSGKITGNVSNCRFENCSTLCNIEGGINEACNSHYILQSNNVFDNLLNRQAMNKMRNADINYGSTTKRINLSASGVWNNRVDGMYWDTDLKKPVYWTGSDWVDANGHRM